jgi:hypothetical protein
MVAAPERLAVMQRLLNVTMDDVVAAALAEPMPNGERIDIADIHSVGYGEAVTAGRIIIAGLARAVIVRSYAKQVAAALQSSECSTWLWLKASRVAPYSQQVARAFARLESRCGYKPPPPEKMKMKITMESTDRIETISGLRCRMWEGVTDGGVKCFAFVPLIAVHKHNDTAAFDRELEAHPDKPTRHWDARMVM